MPSSWVSLSLVAVCVFSIWLAISLAQTSARSSREAEDLEEEIDAIRRFNLATARRKKTGKDLVDSLLDRASFGMRNKK
jgi:hypothetical protein